MSDLLDDVVAAAGLTVFGAAPVRGGIDIPAPSLSAGLGAEITALRAELRELGLDHVVLGATGAAALAARAIASTLGLSLTVLDGADPHQVRAALADRIERTVVVLVAPDAPAVPTDAHRRAYRQAFEDAGLRDAGRRFVIVTAPGSPLSTAARETGAHLFAAPPPVSALSAYGLVAAGLAGADVIGLLAEAAALAEAATAAGQAGRGAPVGFAYDTAPSPPPHISEIPEISASPGVALGTALAAAVREGRDKIALASDGTGLDGLAAWIGRLITDTAPGLVPVVLESPTDWGHEGPDVFSITTGGVLGMGLMPGGGIAPDLAVNGPLGAQLLVWEQAAQVAARLLGDPDATQGPDETEETDDLAGPAFVEGAVEVYGTTTETTLIGAVNELARGIAPGGHLAVAAHLDPVSDAAAAGVRDGLAGRVARAVTFGWGPLPPHPGRGAAAVLQITGAVIGDVPVPGGARTLDGAQTFGELQAALAAAERQALLGRGRPVLRLHLTDRTTGIDQLLAALGG